MSRSQYSLAEWGVPLLVTLGAVAANLDFRLNWQWQPWIAWVDLAIALGGALLIWMVRARTRGSTQQFSMTTGRVARWAHAWGPALLIVQPIVFQPVWRAFASGDPLEIILLSMLQNGAIVAAIPSTTVPPGRSLVLSGFVLIFVTFVHGSVFSWLMCSLSLGLILWWLMSRYWSQVESQSAAGQTRRMPSRGLVLSGTSIVLLLAGCLVHWALGSTEVRRWGEWIPTSGGTSGSDEFARDGLGNGDMVTGGIEQAETVAPIDTELYLSSDQPSLYDMISEVYGKPSRQNDFKIDVSQDIVTTAPEARNQETAASRSLAVHREPRSRPRRTLDRRDSTALFFVSGPVPLHLRHATFDSFDGTQWRSAPTATPTALVRPDDSLGFDWMASASTANAGPQWCGCERHELKIVNLATSTIPIPARLQAWKISRVNRPEFYAWAADGTLFMPGRAQIPSSTVVHLRSHVADRGDLLSRSQFPVAESVVLQSAHLPAWIEQAHQLVADCAVPWERVERIEAWLRASNAWDPARVPPPDCPDVVEFFLRQRGGPDYLFATAAAQMLQAIGIRARLVTGYYADQRHFDPRSRQTIVWKENLHSWVEVCIDGDRWETVEPTPGFALPRRKMTWMQWSLWVWKQTVRWFQVHWLACLAGFGVLAASWRFRLELIDGVTAGLWNLACIVPQLDRCSLLLRLMAVRASLAGRGREPGETWRGWIDRHFPERLGTAAEALAQIDRRLYAGEPTAQFRSTAARAFTELLAMTSARKLTRSRRTPSADRPQYPVGRLQGEISLVEN